MIQIHQIVLRGEKDFQISLLPAISIGDGAANLSNGPLNSRYGLCGSVRPEGLDNFPELTVNRPQMHFEVGNQLKAVVLGVRSKYPVFRKNVILHLLLHDKIAHPIQGRNRLQLCNNKPLLQGILPVCSSRFRRRLFQLPDGNGALEQFLIVTLIGLDFIGV